MNTLRRASPSLALISLFLAVACWMFSRSASPAVPAAWPMLVLLGLGAGLYVWYSAQDGAAALDLGVLHAAVITLYGAFPLAIYLVLDGFYTPLNDNRLFTVQPEPSSIAGLGWVYVLYLASFVAAYVLVRGSRGRVPSIRLTSLARSQLWALLVILVTLRVGLWVADAMYGADADDYLGTYLKYQALPHFARQILTHLGGVSVVLSIVAAVLAAREWHSYRVLVLVWLAFELGMLMTGLGARTQFFLMCLAFGISLHVLHRPLSTRAALGGGVSLLLAFLAIGLIRGFAIGGMEGVGIETIAASSEFESLFANAYDVQRLVESGDWAEHMTGWRLYVGDLINFIPQQLAPWEKLSVSQWYVDTYYMEYADAGGGLAFGAIAQSIAGVGWVDVIWRAALTGAVFAWVERQCLQSSVSVWRFTFYIWLTAFSYQSFRASTFEPVPLFVYQYLPAIGLIAVLGWLVRSAATDRRHSDPAQADRIAATG